MRVATCPLAASSRISRRHCLHTPANAAHAAASWSDVSKTARHIAPIAGPS